MQHLTRFDVALPFLVTAVLVLVGAVFALLVSDRVETYFDQAAKKAKIEEEELPYAFRPKVLGKTSGWIIDASQVLIATLAPLVGLVLLLHKGAPGELVLAYLGVVLIVAIVFVIFLRRAPDKYGWRIPGPITPIVLLSFLLNLAGAYVAYKIGP